MASLLKSRQRSKRRRRQKNHKSPKLSKRSCVRSGKSPKQSKKRSRHRNRQSPKHSKTHSKKKSRRRSRQPSHRKISKRPYRMDGPHIIAERELDALEAAAFNIIDAVESNNVDELAALIEAGADVNAADHLGETQVFMAAVQGNPECLRMLIDAGQMSMLLIRMVKHLYGVQHAGVTQSVYEC